jgi:hypothetical protein
LTSDFACPVVDDHAGITCVFGLLGELLGGSRALDRVYEDRSAIRSFNGEKNYHGIKGGKNRKKKPSQVARADSQVGEVFLRQLTPSQRVHHHVHHGSMTLTTGAEGGRP